jgi:hypothetical protein
MQTKNFKTLLKSAGFFRWYHCNISGRFIEKLFPEEEMTRGGAHHLSNKYIEECRQDKLGFWYSLDEDNQRRFFDAYRETCKEREDSEDSDSDSSPQQKISKT